MIRGKMDAGYRFFVTRHVGEKNVAITRQATNPEEAAQADTIALQNVSPGALRRASGLTRDCIVRTLGNLPNSGAITAVLTGGFVSADLS
jgi:hypothetical protein